MNYSPGQQVMGMIYFRTN
jgi:hypothetical protein